MSRVLTFSRVFPSYHTRKGEPTFFVEKLWRSFVDGGIKEWDFRQYEYQYNLHFPCKYTPEELIKNHEGKHHTIRSGNRWKVGDKFSPRVWGTNVNEKSGRSGPYHSDQITIGPDMEVKKVWKFEVRQGLILIDNKLHAFEELDRLAENDGLNQIDLLDWFRYPKDIRDHQIICWNENINY